MTATTQTATFETSRGKHLPVDEPACWKGKDLRESRAWQYRLSEGDIAELGAALRSVRAKKLDLIAIKREDFPLGAFGRKLAELKGEILNGRGFVLLRGFPVDGYSREDIAALYWGVGCHLGKQVSQNTRGQLLGHVTDLGTKSGKLKPEVEKLKDKIFIHPEVRGYSSNERFFFHVDSCDIVGLMCLHPAKTGGESLVASSATIHNEVLKRRPDLMDVLYEPFWVSRKGEIPEGAEPWFRMPMFQIHNGRFVGHHFPGGIRAGQMMPEIPKLTARQLEALDLVDEIANDRDIHLSMQLEKGDIQFLNNLVLTHTRTAYEDYPEPERRRHMLRLWLVTPEGRDLPQSFYEWHGGGRRGGSYVPGMTEVASLEP